ncbi:hypothetical protein [Novipirellula sp.]|uniref:hypothetical protein n=1 Tax=Novipirellula sp. TaxID=2795430 RepID=UPI003569C9D4
MHRGQQLDLAELAAAAVDALSNRRRELTTMEAVEDVLQITMASGTKSEVLNVKRV